MEKYTIPTIPTAQHILEDIADAEIVQVNNFPDTPQEGVETLQNAYAIFRNFEHLKENLAKVKGMEAKLDELQKQLTESMSKRKKQISS